MSGLLTLDHSGDTTKAVCYRRADLVPGDTVRGPALIVEPQTTTFVSPRFDARIDTAGNIVMTRRAEPHSALGRVGGGDPESAPAPSPAAAPPKASGTAGSARSSRSSKGGRSAIDHEVMWTRLQAVVEEQAQVLIRTAFSPIVRECGDISAGIFDTAGRMLAQAVTGTPGHINTMAASVGLMLDHFPLSTMRPGDVYATNDPWVASGHLNDVLLVAPIFDGERPVALTACTSHLYDLGGRGMGPEWQRRASKRGCSNPADAAWSTGRPRSTDLLMRHPKGQFAHAGVANEGDLYALIACCRRRRSSVCSSHDARSFRARRSGRLVRHLDPRHARGAAARDCGHSPKYRAAFIATADAGSTATTSRSCSTPP